MGCTVLAFGSEKGAHTEMKSRGGGEGDRLFFFFSNQRDTCESQDGCWGGEERLFSFLDLHLARAQKLLGRDIGDKKYVVVRWGG